MSSGGNHLERQRLKLIGNEAVHVTICQHRFAGVCHRDNIREPKSGLVPLAGIILSAHQQVLGNGKPLVVIQMWQHHFHAVIDNMLKMTTRSGTRTCDDQSHRLKLVLGSSQKNDGSVGKAIPSNLPAALLEVLYVRVREQLFVVRIGLYHQVNKCVWCETRAHVIGVCLFVAICNCRREVNQHKKSSYKHINLLKYRRTISVDGGKRQGRWLSYFVGCRVRSISDSCAGMIFGPFSLGDSKFHDVCFGKVICAHQNIVAEVAIRFVRLQESRCHKPVAKLNALGLRLIWVPNLNKSNCKRRMLRVWCVYNICVFNGGNRRIIAQGENADEARCTKNILLQYASVGGRGGVHIGGMKQSVCVISQIINCLHEAVQRELSQRVAFECGFSGKTGNGNKQQPNEKVEWENPTKSLPCKFEHKILPEYCGTFSVNGGTRQGRWSLGAETTSLSALSFGTILEQAANYTQKDADKNECDSQYWVSLSECEYARDERDNCQNAEKHTQLVIRDHFGKPVLAAGARLISCVPMPFQERCLGRRQEKGPCVLITQRMARFWPINGATGRIQGPPRFGLKGSSKRNYQSMRAANQNQLSNGLRGCSKIEKTAVSGAGGFAAHLLLVHVGQPTEQQLFFAQLQQILVEVWEHLTVRRVSCQNAFGGQGVLKPLCVNCIKHQVFAVEAIFAPKNLLYVNLDLVLGTVCRQIDHLDIVWLGRVRFGQVLSRLSDAQAKKHRRDDKGGSPNVQCDVHLAPPRTTTDFSILSGEVEQGVNESAWRCHGEVAA